MSREFSRTAFGPLPFAAIVAAIGLTTLSGWAMDIAALKSVMPGWATMKPNTALCLALSGIALMSLSTPPRRILATGFAGAMATLVIAIAFASLCQYFFDVDLHIDQWITRDTASPVGTSTPGRMSPATAFCLVLGGGAILLGALPTALRGRAAAMAALGAALIVIGGLAVAGYICDAALHLRLWNYTGMALHTAVALALLGCGILCVLRREGSLGWTIGWPASVGFAGAVAVMLIAGGTTYAATNKLVDATRWVSHTHEILGSLQQLSTRMAELESGQRGYIILDDQKLLGRREILKSLLTRSLEELDHLVADNPDQAQRLADLQPLIVQRMQFGEETIRLRASEGFPSAQSALSTGRGIELTDAIDARLMVMRDAEVLQLDRRVDVLGAAVTKTLLLLPLGMFLCLTLLALGLFFLNAGMRERAKVQQALRDSEELFAKAFQLSPDYVVIVRASDRVVIKANEAICRLWGSTPADLIGKSSRQFANWSNLDEREAFTRTLSETGKCLNRQFDMRLNDARVRTFEVSARMIVHNGEACILSVMRDITERKQWVEGQLRLASIVDSSDDAIIAKTLDGIITSWNPGAQKLFGYSAAEACGRPMLILFPPDRVEEERQILERIRAGEAVQHFDTVRVRKDGGRIDISVTLSPIVDHHGKVIGASKIARDITERKRSEAALRELNESLELRVATRTQELRAACVRAEDADRIKSAFLATMSHELRTPLNSILGFTGVILQGLAGALNAEQAKQMGMVQRSARHLLALINDILDISKIEAGQLEICMEPFDLRAVVEQVLESVAPMAQRKGLALHLDMPASLPPQHSDRRRVVQILLNLLNNAVKFTERGSVRVKVTLPSDPLAENRRCVQVDVVDTGIGMRPADLQILFEPFRQIDSSLSRQHEGTGLGLAICRRLADLLGGQVSVQSQFGEGSVFSVTLPMAEAA
jgi:PAS domain S-box-containing protein